MYGVTKVDGDQAARWVCTVCQSADDMVPGDDTVARLHVAETGHTVTVSRGFAYQLRRSAKVSLPAGS